MSIFDLLRYLTVLNDWKMNSSNNSNRSIQSNTSINRILTSKGLPTPPERVRSKLRFGSSGQINQNVTPTPELQKPMLPRKCRSMNRISTASGIITPPPRRCFDHSTASLSNTFDNENKTKISGVARSQNNFNPITTSHSIEFCFKPSSLKRKSVQSKIERQPVVSFISSKNWFVRIWGIKYKINRFLLHWYMNWNAVFLAE
jgi:hypothetical protein